MPLRAQSYAAENRGRAQGHSAGTCLRTHHRKNSGRPAAVASRGAGPPRTHQDSVASSPHRRRPRVLGALRAPVVSARPPPCAPRVAGSPPRDTWSVSIGRARRSHSPRLRRSLVAPRACAPSALAGKALASLAAGIRPAPLSGSLDAWSARAAPLGLRPALLPRSPRVSPIGFRPGRFAQSSPRAASKKETPRPRRLRRREDLRGRKRFHNK